LLSFSRRWFQQPLLLKIFSFSIFPFLNLLFHMKDAMDDNIGIFK
jgi:hypothetical protein